LSSLNSQHRFDFLHIGMRDAGISELFEVIEDGPPEGSLKLVEFGTLFSR